MIDVTLENFLQVTLDGSMHQPVLVAFWAGWCADSKQLLPILNKLAPEYADKVTFAGINIEEQPELAAKFHVRNVPTVGLITEKKFLDQFNGVKPESKIRTFIENHLTNPIAPMNHRSGEHLGGEPVNEALLSLQQTINSAPPKLRT